MVQEILRLIVTDWSNTDTAAPLTCMVLHSQNKEVLSAASINIRARDRHFLMFINVENKVWL